MENITSTEKMPMSKIKKWLIGTGIFIFIFLCFVAYSRVDLGMFTLDSIWIVFPWFVLLTGWVIFTIIIIFTKNESFIPSHESSLKYKTPGGILKIVVLVILGLTIAGIIFG